LLNPEQSATPLTVTFNTRREDFPPNLERLQIDKVMLYFARKQGAAFEVEAKLSYNGTSGSFITTEDGLISSQRGSGMSWDLIVNGQGPAGEWKLEITDSTNIHDRFRNEEIEDILFVIGYSGRTLEWPE
jgi:hypothetical protein